MNKAFAIRIADKEIKGLPILSLVSVKKASGQYGMEIECEGTCLFAYEGPGPTWSGHRDGSLRDRPESQELVLNKPLDYPKAFAAINELFDSFASRNVSLNESNRTSMHIHINVQSWYANKLAAFVSLWFIFEELLSEWCGETRVGNLFCLRGKDSEAIVTAFYLAIKEAQFGSFAGDNLKYSALNGSAIVKQGSVEVRNMKGPVNRYEAINWLNIVDSFVQAAETFKENPGKIAQDLSVLGPCDFLKNEILGEENYKIVVDKTGWSEEDISFSAYQGIRMCQRILYALDWSFFKETKPDPFSRRENRVAQDPPFPPQQRRGRIFEYINVLTGLTTMYTEQHRIPEDCIRSNFELGPRVSLLTLPDGRFRAQDREVPIPLGARLASDRETEAFLNGLRDRLGDGGRGEENGF